MTAIARELDYPDQAADRALADILAKLNVSLAVTGPLTDGQLRANPVPVDVGGRLPAGMHTDGSMKVADVFTGGEALADQTGDGTVKTFTFASPVDLVWVRCVAVAGRCDPFGGTPSATQGIYCAADEPNPMTIRTSSVKVFAASGQISVWGYRG